MNNVMNYTDAFSWFLSLSKAQREAHIKVSKVLVRARYHLCMADAITEIFHRQQNQARESLYAVNAKY